MCNQCLAHSEKVQKWMLTLPTSPQVKNNTTHRNADLSYSSTCKSKKKRLNNLGVESGIEVTGGWVGVGRRDIYESGKQEPKCCKEGYWLYSLGGEYSLGQAAVQARVIRVLLVFEGLEYERPWFDYYMSYIWIKL